MSIEKINYTEMIETNDQNLLQQYILLHFDDPDESIWVMGAIGHLEEGDFLRELLTGKYVIEAAQRIEKLTGKTLYEYVECYGIAGKVIPAIQKAERPTEEYYKRIYLDGFHKRKFGYYFGEDGPRLDLHDLEEQVYKPDLDEAYKNISWHDIDYRLYYKMCRGLDASDEFSYISSQGDEDEFRAIRSEYRAWSIKKLSKMDLLKDGD